ncbi:exonuclease domain-containing protein [Lamprobacter modestohalophilus]|uniref:exonuclease domain-containing protein n=1 Tax=Lamprobacter modestohalophilus TaxID=1064514 RepID=UPI002ADEE561|nr:exonuclease domain-containing protein [Lamprobacter modestohalophilus]MEA1049159.1 exonuclease domain-containing protein [Lamprobacter modestohalophilus]
MDQIHWILLDTETTGIKAPIYVVELAAQRMRGWEPAGEPFQQMLHHGVEIPPEAARVNGYTREILERDGHPPRTVYADFADYVGNHPLVAYNLHYDLNEVLQPEWARLGLEPIGRPGFCALRLTQRLLDPVPAGNHKLQTLRQFYRLPQRGAHTALGDVATVADLLQQVLRPLAEERGLTTWGAISAFTTAPWFPSRIAFGKFKGRPFREALDDEELHGWLEWLASASNPRSAEMGRWYLDQLEAVTASTEAESPVVEVGLSDSSELMLFRDPELETLRQLVAGARLAELEVEYTQEHHGVDVVQSELFMLLRPHYKRRDALRLRVQYRRKYLDTLLIEGEEEAETVAQEHEQAKAETEREYEDAAEQAADTHALSNAEQQELKDVYKKLVRLYHPDRFAHEPEKQSIYERLTQEVNQARDKGDIERLREIANDPNGFLLRLGLGSLDFSDEAELAKLRQLYETLQTRILDLLDELEQLRESGEYELYKLSRERPEFVREIAEQQADAIDADITALQVEADQLAEEIEGLTGTDDPFRG